MCSYETVSWSHDSESWLPPFFTARLHQPWLVFQMRGKLNDYSDGKNTPNTMKIGRIIDSSSMFSPWVMSWHHEWKSQTFPPASYFIKLWGLIVEIWPTLDIIPIQNIVLWKYWFQQITGFMRIGLSLFWGAATKMIIQVLVWIRH